MKKVVISSVILSLILWPVYAQQTPTMKEPDMQSPIESIATTPSLTPDMEAAEALKKLEASKKSEEELKAACPLSAQPDEDEDDNEDDDYDFDEDEDDGDWDEDDMDEDAD